MVCYDIGVGVTNGLELPECWDEQVPDMSVRLHRSMHMDKTTRDVRGVISTRPLLTEMHVGWIEPLMVSFKSEGASYSMCIAIMIMMVHLNFAYLCDRLCPVPSLSSAQ